MHELQKGFIESVILMLLYLRYKAKRVLKNHESHQVAVMAFLRDWLFLAFHLRKIRAENIHVCPMTSLKT